MAKPAVAAVSGVSRLAWTRGAVTLDCTTFAQQWEETPMPEPFIDSVTRRAAAVSHGGSPLGPSVARRSPRPPLASLPRKRGT